MPFHVRLRLQRAAIEAMSDMLNGDDQPNLPLDHHHPEHPSA